MSAPRQLRMWMLSQLQLFADASYIAEDSLVIKLPNLQTVTLLQISKKCMNYKFRHSSHCSTLPSIIHNQLISPMHERGHNCYHAV